MAEAATEQVADSQLAAIESACVKLEYWPHAGRPRDGLLPGLRSVLAVPYVIFYRVQNDVVEVVRVLHGRRDIDSIFGEPSDG